MKSSKYHMHTCLYTWYSPGHRPNACQIPYGSCMISPCLNEQRRGISDLCRKPPASFPARTRPCAHNPPPRSLHIHGLARTTLPSFSAHPRPCVVHNHTETSREGEFGEGACAEFSLSTTKTTMLNLLFFINKMAERHA